MTASPIAPARTFLLGALLLGAVLGLGACGPDAPDRPDDASPDVRSWIPDSMTISRMLATDNRFSTLRAALDSATLAARLGNDGPLTLFAPPNNAFDALPPGTVERLLADDTDRLRVVLAHHLVTGRVPADVSADTQLIMESGDTLTLRSRADAPRLGEARVVDGNIEAANGVIHVIDQVLAPPPSPDETP